MVSFTGQSAKYASKFINSTNCHVFLTGKAGTGKTTFLKYITENSHKNTIVAAPTGIAAINASGVTLHSLFQLPFGTFLPSDSVNFDSQVSVQINTPQSLLKDRTINKTKIAMLRQLELLIIDEVSMLRADLLDAINVILQSIRRNRRPFGGVQVLFIGDLWQLPPVVKDGEWRYLQQYYSSIFFFDALVLRDNKPLLIELDKIYRQTDMKFINLLNNLRDNRMSKDDIDELNNHFKPDFEADKNDGYIQLVTHNYQADNLNRDALQRLPEKSFFYDPVIEGEFNENQFPVEFVLELKLGAQVMFLKNDYSGEGRYFNGKIGVISEISEDSIEVEFSDGSQSTTVDPYTWENKRFTLNKETNLIDEKTLGTFTHYPLKLAWAITVHKSQGLTFEKAIIDVSKAFASGQIYVALSRLTSLNGLVLTSPIPTSGIEPEKSLKEYVSSKKEAFELENIFIKESQQYITEFVLNSFDFSYLKRQIGFHVDSYTKDEKKSKKQLYRLWAAALQKDAEEIIEVSAKFQKQLKFIIYSNKNELIKHLLERVVSAKTYFEPRLKNFSDGILVQVDTLVLIKGVKKYISELRDLELLFFRQLQMIYKSEALLNSSLHEKEFTKEEFEETGIFKNRNIITKDSKKLKAKKSPKEKTEKVDTREVSYSSFKEGKTVEEISKERGFTITTIEKHLSGYVAKGKIDVTEFISQDNADKILDAIEETKTTKLGDLMRHLGKGFSYRDLNFGVAYYFSVLNDSSENYS